MTDNMTNQFDGIRILMYKNFKLTPFRTGFDLSQTETI